MQWFIFVVLSLIFVVSPFSKGLYFDEDFYLYAIGIFVLFLINIIYVVAKRGKQHKRSAWYIWLLPLSFALSLPFAVSPEGAIGSFIRWNSYASFFMLLFWSFDNKVIIKQAPVVFQLTGIVISFSMIFFYLGLISYHDSMIADRFAGVFQYPNTFGMVSGVFLLFSIIMLTDVKLTKREVILYSFPLISFGTNLIQSGSKGMFIVVPLLWLMTLFILNVKQQIRYLAISLVMAICTIIGIMVLKLNVLPAILSFLFASCSVVIMIMGFNKSRFVNHLIGKIRVNRFLIPSTGMIMGLLFIADIANEGIMYKMLPIPIQSQLGNISLDASTANERIIVAKDALKAFSEAPILGGGGGAWEAIYPGYQSLPYQTKSIHNGYIEWLVSNGIIGSMLILAVLFYFLRQVIRHSRVFEDEILYKGTLVSLFIILLHSFIDFNLSYGTVWLMVLWLLAMGMTTQQVVKPALKDNILKRQKYLSIFRVGIVSLTVVITSLFALRFMLANDYYQQARASEVLETKEKLMLKAVSLNPYEINYWFEMGEISSYYVYQLNMLEKQNQVRRSLVRAVQLEEENPFVLYRSGLLLEKIGDLEGSLEYFEKALKHDHYNSDLYAKIVKNKVILGIRLSNEIFYNDAINVYNKNLEWLQFYMDQPEGHKKEFNSRDFTVLNETRFYTALAFLKKEIYTQSIYVLEQYSSDETDLSLNEQALKFITYEKAGKPEIAQKVIEGDKQQFLQLINEMNTKFALKH